MTVKQLMTLLSTLRDDAEVVMDVVGDDGVYTTPVKDAKQDRIVPPKCYTCKHTPEPYFRVSLKGNI
jgi:hypothetical protein